MGLMENISSNTWTSFVIDLIEGAVKLNYLIDCCLLVRLRLL